MFRELYDTTDEVEKKGYIWCRIKQTKGYVKKTQPVKIQWLINEFGQDGSKLLSTPVKTGSVLVEEALNSPQVNEKDSTKLPSMIGVLLHMGRHSRHNCINPTRECSAYEQRYGGIR